MVEDRDDSFPPFYTSLNIHDKILHNCLLDSGASHNLMPKEMMDELGLDITKPYHDLFSFDSRKVTCLGLIKDLVINLAQLPMRSMVMDVVVVDIPPKFDLLLSNNIAEYEALILGLNAAKEMGIKGLKCLEMLIYHSASE
jgi:hypothetical protein